MRAAAAIAGREIRSYFLTPGGYVIAALYLLVNGWLFVRYVFNQGELATLRPIFSFSMLAFMLICPAITMRVVSDELRMGTIETLLTAPVRTADIILGKYAAALGFLALLLMPTLVFVVALEVYGRPDYGELLCGYLRGHSGYTRHHHSPRSPIQLHAIQGMVWKQSTLDPLPIRPLGRRSFR